MENMIVVWLITLLFASMPISIALLFTTFVVPRKKEGVMNDLEKAGAQNLEFVQDRGGTSAVSEQIDEYLRSRVLLIPAALLTTLYLVCFGFVNAYVNLTFHDGHIIFFPNKMVVAGSPLVFTFIGVYLFSLGAMLRRFYLADLTAQVFWGGINRLLLSLGLAMVILKTPFPKVEEYVYFSVGFLSDVFLDWVLDTAMTVAHLGKPKREDLSLRMIRGINLWKEYRLEEEGIENVQNLATTDVIELAVKTHYSLQTLLDWIDQAIVINRFGQCVNELEKAGLNISAVEFAWMSPENSNGDQTIANKIAEILKMEPAFISAQLDSLFEDQYVRNLWLLWQSKPDFQKRVVGSSGTAAAAKAS